MRIVCAFHETFIQYGFNCHKLQFYISHIHILPTIQISRLPILTSDNTVNAKNNQLDIGIFEFLGISSAKINHRKPPTSDVRQNHSIFSSPYTGKNVCNTHAIMPNRMHTNTPKAIATMVTFVGGISSGE